MLLSEQRAEKGSTPARKVVSYKAELAHGNTRYPGFIGNLSSDSLYMITFPSNNPVRLTPGTMLQVKLDPPDKEPVCLHCKVKWSYKTPPHGLTQSIGMEIIDSFPSFHDLMSDFI